MALPIYQVDAFASRAFRGNPAAVVPLDAWIDDGIMQAIGAENNLSETAFFVESASADADFDLRWFTPAREVKLCGHATLASAHVLFEHLGFGGDSVRFATRHKGVLTAARSGDSIVLDFPTTELREADPPEGLSEALGSAPEAVYDAGEDLLAVYGSKSQVHGLEPDFGRLARVPVRAVIATAPGAGHDFVSRFFVPRFGIDEDPVTGSAHCALTPYWASRLGKTVLTGHQVSKRGGEVACELDGDRVRLGGRCATYMRGEITAPLA